MTNFDIGKIQAGMAALIGAPVDVNSSFRKGTALGPGRTREALYGGSSNLCVETGLDLAARADWVDLGDIDFPVGQSVFSRIEETAARLISRGARVLALGGDHSISVPLMRACSPRYPEITILQLDAHPDLYDEFEGNRNSHACPFARIMEATPNARLVQVGIRTMTPHQRRQAERFGAEVVDMHRFHGKGLPDINGPVYLSLDMDVLDPAFAPGVSHHEPGGLSTREVLGVIQGLDAPIVGADIVECNPERDHMGMTAMAAAKFLKEVLARMLEGP